MFEYVILCSAAFLAALIDAVVGGGGLINVPALFSVYPNMQPATLLGTNKLGGVFGTSAAALNYARIVKISWRVAIPAAVCAFLFALIGAYTVTQISPAMLRKFLPFILVALAIYVFRKKNLGQFHLPTLSGYREWIFAGLTGITIGFYDGFFGPGTGSFLIFIFVRFFGFDFLNASAVSKIVNVACNSAALLLFGLRGHVLWRVGFAMAVCGVVGSLVGTRFALKRGSQFIRVLFLCVVVLLIMKTFYDGYFR